MHAGEALWNLCAVLTAFDRKASGKPEVLRLTGLGHESLRVIAEHLKVPLPDASSLEARVNALTAPLNPRAEERKAATMSGEAREAITMADSILEDLEELPSEASEFAESVGAKVRSMKEWMESSGRATEKMTTALQNMRGGVDKWLKQGDSEWSGDHEGEYQ